jgi:hypothetical protein
MRVRQGEEGVSMEAKFTFSKAVDAFSKVVVMEGRYKL